MADLWLVVQLFFLLFYSFVRFSISLFGGMEKRSSLVFRFSADLFRFSALVFQKRGTQNLQILVCAEWIHFFSRREKGLELQFLPHFLLFV